MWWLLSAWIVGEFVVFLSLWQAATGLLLVFPISLAVSVKRPAWMPLCLLVIGLLMAQLSLTWQRSQWLPAMFDGQVVSLQGQVTGLPEKLVSSSARGTPTILHLRRVKLLGSPEQWPNTHRVRLYDYGEHGYRPGDWIKAEAKLYRPRGLVNSGSVDLARLDLARGQDASGSIQTLISQQSGFAPVDQLRNRISQRIQSNLSGQAKAAGLVSALVVGDWRYLDKDSWQLYQHAGVAHLVVISGEHLTLVAGLAWLFFRFICLPLVWRRGVHASAQQWAVMPALIVATGYCLLAGWSVSTLRALVMLSIWLFCRLYRRRWPKQRVLALALLAIFIWQPLSPLSNSFWLSFLAVSILVLVMESRPSIFGLQCIMSLVVGALAAFMFAQWWSIDAIANLLMIPLFSFVLVPLSLIGALVPHMTWLLQLIAPLVPLQESLLKQLLHWAPTLPIPPTWSSCALLMCALLIGLGRFLPWPRWSLLFLCLPWIYPATTALAKGEFELVMFDVGQGQATVVRTQQGLVLYDMGPRWLTSDAGESVVLPWLRRQRQPVLLAFASHGDADHIGGLDALRSELPTNGLFSGEPDRVTGSRPCVAGQYWHFSGVRFQVLWPPKDLRVTQNNTRSCVVRVQGRFGSLLLTGDIPKPVEFWLLANKPDTLGATVLQLAHHGSASSSSYAFLRAVAPDIAVGSAGYLNHLHHPALEVRDKLVRMSVPLLRTDLEGMLTICVNNVGLKVYRERERYRPWEETLTTSWRAATDETKRRNP